VNVDFMLRNLTLTQTYIQKNQLAIVEVAAPLPVAKISMEPESEGIQKLSENSRAVVPTTKQYIMATGKQALALLQTAARVIPVPLLQDAIGIATKIIEVCEVRGYLHRKDTRTVYIRYVSIRRHQLSNKGSKSYKRGSAIL